MKSKLLKHNCMNQSCDFEEVSHRNRDAMKCPECNGPIMNVEPEGYRPDFVIYDELVEINK